MLGEANEFIRESTNPCSLDSHNDSPSTGSPCILVLSRINPRRWIRAFADQCKVGNDGKASWAP